MNKVGFLVKEDIYSTASEDVEVFLERKYEEYSGANESIEYQAFMERTASSVTKGWMDSFLRVFSKLTEEERNRFHQINYFQEYAKSRHTFVHQQFQTILKDEIQDTETHDEVLDIMLERDLGHYVDDYHNYLAWRQENLEEDESPGIVLQSLQSWAFFLISFAEPNNLPYSKITADDVGCIDLIWEISPNPIPFDMDNEYYGNGEGIAMLKFYPSYLNHLTILSGGYGCERLRISLDGTLSYMKTQEILTTFGDRLLYADS